jgi:hypothetical protein
MSYEDAGEVFAETVPPVLRSRFLGATTPAELELGLVGERGTLGSFERGRAPSQRAVSSCPDLLILPAIARA